MLAQFCNCFQHLLFFFSFFFQHLCMYKYIHSNQQSNLLYSFCFAQGIYEDSILKNLTEWSKSLTINKYLPNNIPKPLILYTTWQDYPEVPHGKKIWKSFMYSWHVNNTGDRGTHPNTTENPHITCDLPQT